MKIRSPTTQLEHLQQRLRNLRLHHPDGHNLEAWAQRCGLGNAAALHTLETLAMQGDGPSLYALAAYLRSLGEDPWPWILDLDQALWRQQPRRQRKSALDALFIAISDGFPALDRVSVGPENKDNPLGWVVWRRIIAHGLAWEEVTTALPEQGTNPLLRLQLLITTGWLMEARDGPALGRWLGLGDDQAADPLLERHQRWWRQAQPDSWKAQPPPGARPEIVVHGLLNGGYQTIVSRRKTKENIAATRTALAGCDHAPQQVETVMKLVRHVVYDSGRRQQEDVQLVIDLVGDLAKQKEWSALQDLYDQILPLAHLCHGVWTDFSLQPVRTAVNEILCSEAPFYHQ